MTEKQIRKEIAEVCKQLHARQLVASTDGNVSARLDENRFLMTPSSISKGRITPKMLIVCDINGKKIRGVGKMTSEAPMHLAVYKNRPDAGGVIHAHPPYATALTVAGVSLADPVLPEVLVALGRIPTTPYITPSSDEAPRVIPRLIKKHDAILLDRHGALICGRTPWDAYYRLEKVEHAALVIYLAKSLGRVQRLSGPQIKRLVAALKLHGVTAKIATLSKDIGTEEQGP